MRILAGLILTLATVVLTASTVLAQSTPIANCRYYAKTQEDFTTALPYCRQAIIDNPDDAEARFLAAKCLAENGELDEAWKSFEWLIARKKNKDKNIRKWAKNGDQQAKYYFQQYFKKGMDAVNTESYHAARREFTAATTIYPTQAAAYLNRGFAETMLEDYDAAMGSFETAISMEPEDETARTYYWEALRQKRARLQADGNLEAEARTAMLAEINGNLRVTLNKLLELDPANAEAIMSLGDIELEEGNTSKALEHFEKGIEIAPENIANVFNIGGQFYNANNYGPAIDALTIVLNTIQDEEDELWRKALEVRGLSYRYNEQWAEAAQDLQRFVDVMTTQGRTKEIEISMYANLGLAYKEAGQADKGMEYLIKFDELKTAEVEGGGL